jgi:tetratricopeptide (TPR) repeat protein
MRVMLPRLLLSPLHCASPVAAGGCSISMRRSRWHLGSGRSPSLAHDPLGIGWALLVQGFYRIRHSAPATAMETLIAAQHHLASAGDTGAVILADVGMARCELNSGRHRAALARLLPHRAEGLRLLRDQERAMLLNGIAGCYSALGDSAQAFAYMYEALRDARPARSYGIDVVLYCNLAHELYELGDYEESLRYLEEGVQRCAQLNNRRLLSTLLINRIVCLTDLDRTVDALPDVERLLQLPSGSTAPVPRPPATSRWRWPPIVPGASIWPTRWPHAPANCWSTTRRPTCGWS